MNPENDVLFEDEVTRVSGIRVEDEDVPEAEPNEDVIGVLMRSSDGAGPGPKQLEVSQVWGDALLSTRRFPLGTSVAVGGGGCAFFAPVLPGGMSRHTLIDGEAMRVPGSWDGFADVGDRRLTFDELVAEGLAKKDGDSFVIPVLGDTRVLVDADGMLFLARRVATPQRTPFSPITMFLTMDFVFAAVAGLTLFVGAALLFVTWLRPPALNTGMTDDSMKDYVVRFAPPPVVPPSAPAPKGEPTKAGDQSGTKEVAKGPPMTKKQRDDRVVTNSGVLMAFNDASFREKFGSGQLPSELGDAIAGLKGPAGAMKGWGGFDLNGVQVGVVGEVGGIGDVGSGGRCIGPNCTGEGFGTQGGVWKKKAEGNIGIAIDDVITMGSLDRSLIDEVIKRNMNRIRYCYQRELAKNASLAGKISMKFTIAGDGSVSSSSVKSSSMGNASVESCLQKTFMQLDFPKPRGGGIVIVSYPFMFDPGS